MKRPDLSSARAFLGDMLSVLAELAARAMQALQDLSIGRLFGLCVGIALAIAILPLACTLFLAALLLKAVVTGAALMTQRRRRAPRLAWTPARREGNAEGESA